MTDPITKIRPDRGGFFQPVRKTIAAAKPQQFKGLPVQGRLSAEG